MQVSKIGKNKRYNGKTENKKKRVQNGKIDVQMGITIAKQTQIKI
jgi:hypothetical protein